MLLLLLVNLALALRWHRRFQKGNLFGQSEIRQSNPSVFLLPVIKLKRLLLRQGPSAVLCHPLKVGHAGLPVLHSVNPAQETKVL